MRVPLRVFVSLCCSVAVAHAFAQAPKVDSLFPAGVQRGEQVEVTLNGKPGSLPLSVHLEGGDGLELTVDEKGKTLIAAAEAGAVPGLLWLRFHNEQGASEPLPFAVGVLPEIRETEPNNRLEEANPVALPAVVNGTLHRTNEVDTFAVDLQSGETLVASVQAHGLLGSPMDTVLQVLSPSGFVLEQNDDDHGMDSLIPFEARETGRHYVRIFAFPAEPNSSIRFAGGADYVYRLTLTTGPFLDHVQPSRNSRLTVRGWNLADEELPLEEALRLPGYQLASALSRLASADSAEASLDERTLTVPGTLIGQISSAGEVDGYSFEASKDQTLEVSAAAIFCRSQLDPVLRVLDSSGKVLAENDDQTRGESDAALRWKAPEEGRYQVQVSDRFGHGSWRHVYELSLKEAKPDYSLSVEAAQFGLEAGKSVEISVEIARNGGYGKPISIAAVDLPEGVTCEPLTSEPKGNSSKSVKLKLLAGKEAVASAPFRIAGRDAEESEPPVPATAALKSADARTGLLWLTVTPGK